MKLPVSIVIALLSSWSGAEAQQVVHGTGLEWDGKELWVGIGELSRDAQELGLTEGRIRTQCELRLRKAGLVPLESPSGKGYLSIDVVVRGTAFSMSVSMVRFAAYSTSRGTFQKLAKTWEKSGAGTHDKDPEYLMSALGSLLEGFLNDFAVANPPKR